MFKKHPKGLIPAALANMGERYGFYTMMAILALFLQAKFGLDETNTGLIYSSFYALIYLSSLAGGAIADKLNNYKGTILMGLIVMTAGYVIMSIPTSTPVANLPLMLGFSLFALLIIALGNGLFKGNLQALIGQIYDNYEKANLGLSEKVKTDLREEGYRIFYMFINIGAIFAPFTAIGIRNWWLNHNGLAYSPELPGYCHSFLKGNLTDEGANTLQTLADKVSGEHVTNISSFVNEYLNIFTTGFHYAFGIAIFAMLISLVIYLINKKSFPTPQKFVATVNKNLTTEEITKEAKEVKQRLYALFAVFGVVIFFWFSFHQNGLTLTFFARDYTLLHIGSWKLSAESFSAMNPFFVVFITIAILLLARIFKSKDENKKGMSTPMKIAIGMFIAAAAYLLMSIASISLPPFSAIDPSAGGVALTDAQKITPWLLIAVYFIMTIAELFISPLGLAFVSKVAPQKYQGLMQGAWLGATAVGNQLLFIGAILYKSVPMWMTWSAFIFVCVISGIVMLSMVKWLERVTTAKVKEVEA